MAVELSTETRLTEEGGADGAERERERGFQNRRESNIYNYTVVHLPAATVVAVMVSCSVPPPVIVAMTVLEYSVPSSRPVSVYIHCVNTTSNVRDHGCRVRDTVSVIVGVGDGVGSSSQTLFQCP